MLASTLTACGSADDDGGNKSDNDSSSSVSKASASQSKPDPSTSKSKPSTNVSKNDRSNEQANDGMLFFASTPEADKELWISDGSPSGTRLLKDIYPGGRGQGKTDDFLTINDKTFFFARDSRPDGRYNTRLWVSNGTESGTYSLEANTGNGNVMTRVGNKVVFNSRSDLWVSDGTKEGTVMIAEDIRPTNMFSAGDYIVFSGKNASGAELWVTDGTQAGTKMLKDIYPGKRGSIPRGFTILNNQVYFTAEDKAHGREMWKTDGTAAGTVLIADLKTGEDVFGGGNNGVVSNQLVTANDKIFFVGHNTSSDKLNAFSLWTSDGTAGGATEVKQFQDMENTIGMLTAFGSKVVFVTGRYGKSNNRLWVSDGTGAGTFQLHDSMDMNVPRAGYYENKFAEVNGKLLFAGNDDNGTELWETDGTRAGTRLLKDINTAPGKSGVLSDFRKYKGNAYFVARYDTGKIGIYKTDGTEAGTKLLIDSSPAAVSSRAYQITGFKAPTGSSNNANAVFEN